jgi:membrane protease YdiL (CAAX protease family)
VSVFLRALAITVAFPVLNRIFMGFAGFLQLRDPSASWAEAWLAADSVPINYALAQAGSVATLFLIAFPGRSKGEGFLDAVNVRPLAGGITALCFAAGLMLQLPFAELGNLAQEVFPVSFDQLARIHRMVNPSSWWAGISALIVLVIVAPVSEELLFRGWLMRDLSARYGPRAGLVSSSVLFGFAHLEPMAIVYATCAGLVLGAVAMKTQSTLGSIATHAGVNALPILLPPNLVRIEGFNTLTQQVEHIHPGLVALSLLLAVGALALVARSMSAGPAD